MESNHQEDSIYSSDQEGQKGNNFGEGRSYECVFCRRGFNTAQALGGHMNIHRKDRSRNKATTGGPTRLVQRCSSSQLVAPKEDVQIDYRTYNLPASTSNYANPSIYGHNQMHLFNPFGDDHRRIMRLSQEIGSRRGGLIQEEADLDLELRLGH